MTGTRDPRPVLAAREFISGLAVDAGGDAALQQAAQDLSASDAEESVVAALELLQSPHLKKELRDRFFATDGHRLVVHAMARLNESADVLQLGCNVLAVAMKAFSQVQRKLRECGALTYVLELLKSWTKAVPILVAVLNLLRFAAFDKDNRVFLVEEGSVDLILNVAREYGSNPALLIAVWPVLSNVSYGSTQVKDMVGRSGAIEVMLASIANLADDSDYLIEVYSGLRNLTYSCRPNQNVVHALNSFDSFLNSMRRHEDNTMLLELGFSSLSNVTVDHPGNVAAFSACGGLDWTLALLAKLSEPWSLIDNCMFVAANAARTCLTQDDAIAVKMVENGGVSVGVKFMSASNAPASVVQKSLILLSSLTSLSEGKDRAVKDRIVEPLVRCLEQNIKDALVVKPCVSALTLITSFDESAKDQAIRSSAILATVSAVAEHKENAQIVLLSCTFLDGLLDGVNLNGSTTEKLLIDEVLVVMATYPDDPRVQEHCCGILCKIGVWGNKTASNFSDPHVIKMVEAARDRHKGDYSVESLANQFLTLVMSDSSARQGRSQLPGSGASSRLGSRPRTVGSAGARSRSRTATKSRSPPRTRTRRPGMAMQGIPEEAEGCE